MSGVGNVEAFPLSSAESDSEGGIIVKERLASLREALLRMNTEDREIIVLRYLDEWSLEDIAVIEGITLSSAKMRLYRGLAKMKTHMEKREG